MSILLSLVEPKLDLIALKVIDPEPRTVLYDVDRVPPPTAIDVKSFKELLDTNKELSSWVVKKEGHVAYFIPKSIRMCNARREMLENTDRMEFAETVTFGSVLTKDMLLQILQSYDSFTFGKRDVRLEQNLTNMGEHVHVEADLPKEVNLSNDVKKQIYNLVKQASNSTVQ